MVDLGLDVKLTGRAAKPLSAEVTRELTQSDLALLATERGVKPTALKRITDRHHALARCLATGMNAAQISLITGYTPSRISVLKGDPAFEELIEFYREAKAEIVHDFQDKAVMVRNEAADFLLEKFDEDRDKLTPEFALDVSKVYMDRTGHGPSKTTNTNLNVGFGDRLANARVREQRELVAKGTHLNDSGSSGSPTTIDGEFTEVPSRRREQG